jgi:hypothetical protein
MFNRVLVATGRSRETMRATLITGAVLTPLFLVGSRWGVAGVSFVWVVAYPLVSFLTLARPALRICEMTFAEYLRALGPIMQATAGMAAVLLAASWAMPDSWPLLARFGIKVALGVGAYAGIMFLVNRERLRAFLRMLKRTHAG